jgi:hypothetical protein
MASTLPINAAQNITGAKSYFDWVQEVSNGSFFASILLGLFIIMFMIFKGATSNGKAFIGASFICMVFAILLTTLGWLAPMYMYITIVLTAIGAVWSYMDDSFE